MDLLLRMASLDQLALFAWVGVLVWGVHLLRLQTKLYYRVCREASQPAIASIYTFPKQIVVSEQ